MEIIYEASKWLWEHRNSPLTWGLLLSFLAFVFDQGAKKLVEHQLRRFFRRHNPQLDRMEAKLDYLIQQGGGTWPADTSTPIITRLPRLVGAGSISSWVGGLTVRCARKFMNLHLRRMNMLNNIHIRNGGAVVIGLLVTYLNKRFGWNLDANAIVTLWGLILAFISREAYLNLHKFCESLLTNVAASAKEAAVTTSGEPIDTLMPKPMTQEEATAVLKELSDLLTPIYDSVKSGRKTEATDQLLTAAVAIRDYLKKVG